MSPNSELLQYAGQDHVVLGVCIPGVVLLVAVAYLQWNPASRAHLNRVSFRLLLYALVANMVFGSLPFIPVQETSPTCSFKAFIDRTTFMFSVCMFFCMAINLVFVLVYGLNGNRLEKYYILGSLFLVGACNIPVWASGALGCVVLSLNSGDELRRELSWNAVYGTCWLRADERELQWLIGTKTVWLIIMTLLEVLSFVQILVFMVRTQLRIRRLRTDTGSGNLGRTDSESGIGTLRSSLPKSPIVRYRSMIIRIGLYPLLSCFLTFTSSFTDVYTIIHVDFTEYYNRLKILGMFTYTLRPLLYVLLAAVDPSFLRAIRALRPGEPSGGVQTKPWGLSMSMPGLPQDSSSASADSIVVEGTCKGPAGEESGQQRHAAKETGTDDEDEMQVASIARQI
ncbi:hypothetical protein GGX14DRAFT_580931 [Mycena pura]|uniref:Uncharacterized protein n=1 Tax=Mycena pura TaxID=153505 RepID=A0AAD6URW3_9AGAR|nr:hypothetical protein GGX14DRAFT_580931 [Mycena pura]